jgi:hypothetical protein
MISNEARPGLRRPKNKADQATLRISCAAKTVNAARRCSPSDLHHTSQADMAIKVYSADHTAPIDAPEGVQEGFIRPGYQSFTDKLVRIDPTYAAPKQMNRKTARTIGLCSLIMGSVHRTFRNSFHGTAIFITSLLSRSPSRFIARSYSSFRFEPPFQSKW